MFGKTKRQLTTNLSPKTSVYDEVCTVGLTKCLDLQFGDRDTIAVFVAIFIAFGFVLCLSCKGHKALSSTISRQLL